MREASDTPTITCKTSAEWEQWLDQHYEDSQGIWLKIFKKNSGIQSISFAEALDAALCYGWIDSQMKGYDEHAYIQKFSPRKSKSTWSKINQGHVERLIKSGKMKPAGLRLVEEAKKDGRWK